MNRRGFTLVEVLAIIVILGIILGVVVPSTFSIVKRGKETSYKTLVNSFKNGSKIYATRYINIINTDIDKFGYYKLTLSDLNNNNLLKTPVIDPRTDTSINLNKYIIITRNTENVFSYCYEEEVRCLIPSSVEETNKEIKPIITINGSKVININKGTEYTDLGATATDDIDGDITSKITVVNNVNINVAGEYKVIYTITDSDGNKRVSARVINVLEV